MTLLSCQHLAKSHGGRLLFHEISFGIHPGDRIGLIGHNGSGKSTLLKILSGFESADEGLVVRSRQLRLSYVAQETTFPERPLQEILLCSLQEAGEAPSPHLSTRIAVMLSKMGFVNPHLLPSSLSGGWKKRLALAAALVCEPDLLLLDEPTNHLDLEGVIWLERLLREATFAYVVVSHDRYFLEQVTNRMMELDRAYPKGLFTAEGNYHLFLERREEFLSGQRQQERSLSSKVRREIEWLQQNPKARTTKSNARIQEAEVLIQKWRALKTAHTTSQTDFRFSSSERGSQKLLVAHNIAKSMGDRLLFSSLNLVLSPGVRLGIVGCNGSGKTTLLRLLAGQLSPDSGTIKYATGLKIVYFDQHRTQIDPTLSLRRALAPEGDRIDYRGQSIHVNGWARRFLFSPDRLELPFGHLSGGEKARVHIAQLIRQPADILFLDEPTNDLDIPTLEVLQQSLLEFPGAVVLISHDRYLLDQVSTVILGLGNPHHCSLWADYAQWERAEGGQLLAQTSATQASTTRAPAREKIPLAPPRERGAKPSYAEKREWEQMPQAIDALEKEVGQLTAQIEGLASLSQSEQLQTACRQLEEKSRKLETLYNRWQELETLYGTN